MGSLHQCLLEKRYNQFALLVKIGVDVNEVDDNLLPPLIKVCHIPNVKVCERLLRLLIRNGANPDVSDDEGLNILHVACKLNNAALVRTISRLLPDFGMKNTDMYGNSAMHYAASHKTTKVMEILLPICKRYSVDVDERNKLGFTPLLIAASNGHLDMVRLLVRDCHVSTSICDGLYFKTVQEWLKIHYDAPENWDFKSDSFSTTHAAKHESLVKVEKLNLVPVTTSPSPNDIMRSYSRKLALSKSIPNNGITVIAKCPARPKTAPSIYQDKGRSLRQASHRVRHSNLPETKSDPGDYRTFIETTQTRNVPFSGKDCWATVVEMSSISCAQLSPTYRKTIIPTWPKPEPTVEPILKLFKGKSEAGSRAVSSLLGMFKGKKTPNDDQSDWDVTSVGRATAVRLKFFNKLGAKRLASEKDRSLPVSPRGNDQSKSPTPQEPIDERDLKAASILRRVMSGRKGVQLQAPVSVKTSPESPTT